MSKIVRPYVVTPLLAPEYTTLQEISSAINYWAVLKSTLHRLEFLKVRPPRTSRLHQALEVLETSIPGTSGGLDLSDDRRRCAGEAYRIALEFWTISRTLTLGLISNARFKTLLQRAYAGQLDPVSNDQTSERARDAQFELWLGSWFAMGDRPVRAVEPDLRATLWFRWYSVAAKRVRSPGQLVKRVQEAADQIRLRGAGDYGLVAISLDNYSDRSVPLASGIGPGNEFFGMYPELDVAESWLMQKAPLVKGTFCFGLLTSWGLPVDGRPAFDMSALERVMFLNSEKPEQQHLTDVLQEARLVRQSRWGELQRFAPHHG